MRWNPFPESDFGTTYVVAKRSVSAACALSFVVVAAALSLAPLSADSTDDSRQVTVMSILARKDAGETDPKLESVRYQLEKVLPNHRFELIEGKTKRLEPGESMKSKAGEGRELTVELTKAGDDDGKVVILIRLIAEGQEPFRSVVRTPPNQLFFLDRKLSDTERLLIAVGAR